MLLHISISLLLGHDLVDSKCLLLIVGPLTVMLCLGLVQHFVEVDGLRIKKVICLFLQLLSHLLLSYLLLTPVLLL